MIKLSKFLSLIDTKCLSTFLDIDCNHVTYKTQDTTLKTILFYNLKNTGQEELDKLYSRITNTQFGALFLNKEISLKRENVFFVPSSHWSEAQKIICDVIYPMPTNLKIIGVTGTNGKTTTTYLLTQLFDLIDQEAISIGTLGVVKNKRIVEDFGLTSPNYLDLRRYLNKYLSSNGVAIVEVSSHALIQERLYKINLHAAAWTSFSQDHLDYHVTMEEYFNAKMRILDLLKEGPCYVHAGCRDLVLKLQNISKIKIINHQIEYEKLHVPFFFADYNKRNLDIAIALFKFVSNKAVELSDINKLEMTPGRFEIIQYKNGHVVIDYAHTPDAIINITKEIKEVMKKKITLVFGCGGDRDKSKRPLMAKAARLYSNSIIVTSDNPRTEDPKEIVNDICKGFESMSNVKIILDRKLAIEYALENMKDEVVIIAGKGHEQYMIVGNSRLHFSDQEIVREYMNVSIVK